MIEYLWLIKMLYFIEREALRRWERPIVYDAYTSMDNGPVMLTIYNLITGNVPSTVWKSHILAYPKASKYRYFVALNGALPRLRKLSDSEVALVNEMYDKLGGHDWKQLIELSHKLPEWRNPHSGRSIPIGVPDLLKHLDYEENDIARIVREITEEAALDQVLGT